MKAVLKNVNDVYDGASSVVPSRRYTSLAHLSGCADVTKAEFAYFAALVVITPPFQIKINMPLLWRQAITDTCDCACFHRPPCSIYCAHIEAVTLTMAVQMDSYSFSFPSDGEEEEESLKVQLVPVLDLINHGDEPNIVLSRHQESSSYVATAVSPIRWAHTEFLFTPHAISGLDDNATRKMRAECCSLGKLMAT